MHAASAVDCISKAYTGLGKSETCFFGFCECWYYLQIEEINPGNFCRRVLAYSISSFVKHIFRVLRSPVAAVGYTSVFIAGNPFFEHGHPGQ